MFRHHVLARVFLCLCLLSPLAAAEETKTYPELTLAQALAVTRQHHPVIRAIEAELRTLEQRVALAGQRAPFTLAFELENFAGSDNLQGLEGAEATLSLSTVLELGDKPEKRVVLAGMENELRRVALVQRHRDLLADTAQRFIDVALAEAQVTQANEALSLAATTLKSSQQRAKAGATAATDVQRARLREQEARLALSLARQRAGSARQALALSMAQPDVLPSIKAEPLRLPNVIPLVQLFVLAEKTEAVQSADARLRIAEAQLRLAQAAARPDITLNGGLRHFEERGDQALVVGFSVPLGSRRRSKPARLLAQGQQQVAEEDSNAAVLQVKALVTKAWHRLAAYHEEVVTLETELQTIATEIVKATEEGYRRGRYSLLELNVAQSDVLTLSQRRLQAAVNFHRTLIEVERLLGEQLVKESAS